ncbi:hypothetical protein LCGC14_2548570, partial [marine sediment metagenome]
MELFDSAGSIVFDSTGWSVTSSSSEEITISGLTWTSLTDTSGDSLEIEIVTTAVSGAALVKAAVQVDEIRLDLTMEGSGPKEATAIVALASSVGG